MPTAAVCAHSKLICYVNPVDLTSRNIGNESLSLGHLLKRPLGMIVLRVPISQPSYLAFQSSPCTGRSNTRVDLSERNLVN